MGLMAGPERPPKPAPIRGFRVRASIARLMKVLTRDRASAPLSSAARASGSMAPTLGESLTISGRVATRLAADTTSLNKCGIAREVDASVRRVGARDVEFVAGQPLVIVEHAQHFQVVFHLVAEDIGEDGRAQPGQRRQFIADEGADSDILQADGVDHAGFAFVDPRRRVAFDRLARQAFDHEAAEGVEIHQFFELHSVGEGAAGRQNRIAQSDAAERRSEVWRHSAKASPSTRPSRRRGLAPRPWRAPGSAPRPHSAREIRRLRP